MNIFDRIALYFCGTAIAITLIITLSKIALLFLMIQIGAIAHA